MSYTDKQTSDQDPALSIIVPMYNDREHILKCLESIAAQTFRNFELLIVDDGSTDDSADLVEDFLHRHPELNGRLIKQSNQGASYARKRGVEEAKGDWIGFVDSDDWCDASYYREFMSFAHLQQCDIVWSEFTQSGVQKEQISRDIALHSKEIMSPDEALLGLFNRTDVYAFTVNKIFRRELFDDIVFPAGHLIGEDFDIVTQLIRRSGQIGHIKSDGYHYITREGSVCRRRIDEHKFRGYENQKRIEKRFTGTTEQEEALQRYLMLEYMSCLILMYRSKVRNREVENEIIEYVKAHRHGYIRYSKDGLAAKVYSLILGRFTNELFHLIWPRKYK